MQVGSQHGIKGPDTMANLVWANTHISGYVLHNSIRHCYTQHVSASYWSVCIFSTIGIFDEPWPYHYQLQVPLTQSTGKIRKGNINSTTVGMQLEMKVL